MCGATHVELVQGTGVLLAHSVERLARLHGTDLAAQVGLDSGTCPNPLRGGNKYAYRL